MTQLANIEPNASLSFQLPVERGLTRQAATSPHLLDTAFLISPHVSPTLAGHYREAAFRLFQTRQQTSTDFNETQGANCQRIFVTSPHQGDGKTCTAFNLAWTLAEQDKNVLLIELNFLRPRLRAALGDLRLRYGLEGALSGTAVPADAVFSLNSTSLYIAAVRNPTPLANLVPLQAKLGAFLRWASENFDLLVIDCPSVLSREWSDWFRNYAAPALLVTREEHTPQAEIQRAVKLLGPALSGVLINAARQVPAQTAPAQTTAQHAPRRIAPNEEVRPPFLQPNASK